MNGDGLLDGRDIQLFVNCLVLGGDCSCADSDATSGVTIDDADQFISDRMAGEVCP